MAPTISPIKRIKKQLNERNEKEKRQELKKKRIVKKKKELREFTKISNLKHNLEVERTPYGSKLVPGPGIKMTLHRKRINPGAVVASLPVNAKLQHLAAELQPPNGFNPNQAGLLDLGAASPWPMSPDRQNYALINAIRNDLIDHFEPEFEQPGNGEGSVPENVLLENEIPGVQNSNDSDSVVSDHDAPNDSVSMNLSDDSNGHDDEGYADSVGTENSNEEAQIGGQGASSVWIDNSVQASFPNNQNKRSYDLVGICSIPIKNKRSRARKAAKLDPYPCKPGTEHPVHVIVYQMRAIEGDIYLLMDWSAADWSGGPTFIKISDHMCPILLRKHLKDKKGYDKWCYSIRTMGQFQKKIEKIETLIRKIENPNEDVKKIINKFEERFINSGQYSVALDSEAFLWHSWHVYNLDRFFKSRLNKSNRAKEGDSQNHGYLDYLRICRHVGEHDTIYQFGPHEKEI